MNVGFFLRQFKTGGVEIVTISLANEFVRKGHKVFIFYANDIDELLQKKLNPNVTLVNIGGKIKSIFKIHNAIKKNSIGIIINQWGLQFYYSIILKLSSVGCKCKLISVYHNKPSINGMIQKASCVHDTVPSFVNKCKLIMIRKIVSISMSVSYFLSDRYVLLSKLYIKDFKSFTRIRNLKKLRVIPNPITCDIRTTDSIKENMVLYVGRLDETQKKVSRIIDVWNYVEKKTLLWKLFILGDGEEKKNLIEKVNLYGLKNIVFVGKTNPVDYYAKAKILILVSDFEGFPLVLSEAMSYSVVPVVYNSFEVASELVNENGALVRDVNSCFNAEKYSEALIELMKNENKLLNYAINSEVKAKNYSIESIYLLWENIWSDVYE